MMKRQKTSTATFLAKSIRSRAPAASSPQVRKVMQAIPSRDTTPEKTLRSLLHRMGLRFRKDVEPENSISCKVDIVFSKAKVCVFIDGCFWHGCPKHFHPPKTNTEWWLEKVQDNRERDERKSTLIEEHGWIVLRYWEHDIKGEDAINIAQAINDVVKKRIGDMGMPDQGRCRAKANLAGVS